MSLSKLLNEWSSKSFDYHGHDCCRFAAAVSECITGSNPMSLFGYDGKLEAYRLIKRYGSLDGVISETLGDPISIDRAKPGDWVVVKADDGQVFSGAVLGDTVVVKTQSCGLLFLPLVDAWKAWSVS